MRRTLEAQRGQTEQDAFSQALPAAAQPQEAVQAEPSQAEAALDYLRRAASRTPSRNGAQNNSPAEQRKGLSFQERLKMQAQEDGLI
jgi:hypothetical protein